MSDRLTTPTPEPSDAHAKRIAAIINAATAGASLAEIAVLEFGERQVVRRCPRPVWRVARPEPTALPCPDNQCGKILAATVRYFSRNSL